MRGRDAEGAARIGRAVAWARARPLGGLWDELRRRMSASERPVKAVTVELDLPGRQALTALLQFDRIVPPRGRLSVDKLSAALGLEGDELRAVVAQLTGPIDNRAKARREVTAAREALWASAVERLGRWVPRTLARIRAAGVPEDEIVSYEDTLRYLAEILEALPLEPPKPLPVVAWEQTDDPHALDSNTTLGRWLAMALVERAGGDPAEATPTAVRRAAFAAGLLTDRLSTPTLTWALRAEPDTPAGRCLAAAAADGVPAHLSGALLDCGAPTLREPFVLCVENPSVLEWLHLTRQSIPTVCTSGWPSVDAQRFVEDLRAEGARIAYAGDYDAAGLAIAVFMRARFGARVLMSDEDYLAARRARSAWEGAVPETPWCPALRRAIETTREVRYQEDPDLRLRLVARVEELRAMG